MRLRNSTQLVSTLEATALALALRGVPAPAHTLYAAIEARGNWMIGAFRRLVEDPLATVPPAEVRTRRESAARFNSIDDVANYARATIASLHTERADQ